MRRVEEGKLSVAAYARDAAVSGGGKVIYRVLLLLLQLLLWLRVP